MHPCITVHVTGRQLDFQPNYCNHTIKSYGTVSLASCNLTNNRTQIWHSQCTLTTARTIANEMKFKHFETGNKKKKKNKNGRANQMVLNQKLQRNFHSSMGVQARKKTLFIVKGNYYKNIIINAHEKLKITFGWKRVASTHATPVWRIDVSCLFNFWRTHHTRSHEHYHAFFHILMRVLRLSVWHSKFSCYIISVDRDRIRNRFFGFHWHTVNG